MTSSIKKGKIKPIKAWMIRNKSVETPWTMQTFQTAAGAKNYWRETCETHNWSFDISSFEIYLVLITPLTPK